MIEKIAGLKIKGKFFEEETVLSFFQNNSRVAIIYGKNGSGKTTISDAFGKFGNGDHEFEEIDFLDSNNVSQNDDIFADRIHVFNESFIDKKVRYADGGLDSVVMFGDQGDIQDQIEALEVETKSLEVEIGILDKEVQKYNDDKDPVSPTYYDKKIEAELKENWALREQRIKKLVHRASVTTNIKSDVLSRMSFFYDQKKLLQIIKEETETIETARDAAPADSSAIQDLNVSKGINDSIRTLLEKKVKKPELTERESQILDLAEQGKDAIFYEDVKQAFTDESTTFCPYCLRDIDSSEKNAVLQAIAHIFDTDEAEEHRGELIGARLTEYFVDYSQYDVIDQELVKQITTQIRDYNHAIDSTNQAISKKLSQIYAPILDYDVDLYFVASALEESINDLRAKIDNYNDQISAIEKIIYSAQLHNIELAVEEVREYYNQKVSQEEAKRLFDKQILTKKERQEEVARNISKLNAKKSNITIASDLLNQFLKYIFFDKNRLYVSEQRGKYIVFSRGHNIRLEALSVGERNVIALCYFLSTLFKEKSEENMFSDDILLVIDDPISSYDFENKVGVYSLIRLMLEKILEGNKNSRCIIFSHELEAVSHLQKVLSDINQKCPARELKNKSIVKRQNKNEYTSLLKNIFKYANNDPGYEELHETIGNIMRKALEAFGTFLYKAGIDKLSTDPLIIGQLPNQNMQDHFKGLMYRLVLNSESHLNEQTEAFPETSFVDYFSDEEKIRTAKEILVFICLINPQHIEKHLGADPYTRIREWEREIFPGESK